MLFVVCFFDECCWLSAVVCLALVVLCRVLFEVCCLMWLAYRWFWSSLLVVRCVVFVVVWSSLFAVDWLSRFVRCCRWFVVCCLLVCVCCYLIIVC